MRYDMTIYDIPETGKNLIQQILDEGEIRYTTEPSTAQAYLDESGSWLAAKVGVDKVVTAFKIDPKGAKSHFGWNGSMANKFLRLAGVWDGLSQAEKNIILGYKVAPRSPEPPVEGMPNNGPGGGY